MRSIRLILPQILLKSRVFFFFFFSGGDHAAIRGQRARSPVGPQACYSTEVLALLLLFGLEVLRRAARRAREDEGSGETDGFQFETLRGKKSHEMSSWKPSPDPCFDRKHAEKDGIYGSPRWSVWICGT